MDSVTIIITRRASYVGMAMPVKVLINGMLVGQIKVGRSLQVIIPPKDCTLELDMVGNSMNMHPIKASYPLVVSNCTKGVVSIDFGIKSNVLGILTSGIWKKIGDIEADIKYL